MDSAVTERFFRYVNQTPTEKGCLLWQGPTTKGGYGLFRVNTTRSGPRRNLTCAHRIAWEIANGPIPNRLYCLHSCDNPPCINAEHLFLGTQKKNIADAREKGRLATGERHGLHKHPETIARGERHGSKTHPEKWPRGERVGTAKLNADQIVQIRRKYDFKKTSQKELGKEYGVSEASIHKIVNRKAWTHIQ